ncbi:hypothetical protein [Haliea sp. E17]|uniref:hypothetical protein n=1 Tax=Haliea sp. E17 TaxID=3401576 RepID=UPI003AAFAF2D
MHTEVKDIVSLGVCKDGASLSVTFLDPENTRHKMVFRIDNDASQTSDGMSIYRSALIESIITAERLNPVTCVSSLETVVRKTPVSWEKAAEILLNLGPLVANFSSANNWVFKSMQEVAGSELHAVKCSW